MATRVLGVLLPGAETWDAARVAPISKLSAELVAVFGVGILGEPLSVSNWIGVAFIAAEAVVFAGSFLPTLVQ